MSRLREQIAGRLNGQGDKQGAFEQVVRDIGLSEPARGQLGDYLASAHAAPGTVPTQHTVTFERLFDAPGGKPARALPR